MHSSRLGKGSDPPKRAAHCVSVVLEFLRVSLTQRFRETPATVDRTEQGRVLHQTMSKAGRISSCNI